MAKRRIRIKPGDIIEIPVGDGWLAYARKYQCLSYRPYRIVSKDRPEIADIIASGFLQLRTVAEYQSETGAWPIIGRHPFSPGEDSWAPPVISSGWISFREEDRVATPEEIKQFPEDIHYDEASFVDLLRKELLGLPPLRTTAPREIQDPLTAAMSIDHNDIAERVILEFDDFVADGLSPEKAIQRTIKRFREELDDSDEEPEVRLALALLGLRNNCLTPQLRESAIDVIESGRCWDVVDRVESESLRKEALEIRERVIKELKIQLAGT